jgi:hypothetical protein
VILFFYIVSWSNTLNYKSTSGAIIGPIKIFFKHVVNTLYACKNKQSSIKIHCMYEKCAELG